MDNKDVTLSLKVIINKEKSKVLFAEADSQFVDILLSFLTFPLGRIVKVLKKHYGDEAPTIGSLNSLYHSLANLDNAHFLTEGAKQTLLNPTSSFNVEYERLKFDISDSPPAQYFSCCFCLGSRFCSASIYYDNANPCKRCRTNGMTKEEAKRGSQAASGDGDGDGVFTSRRASFVISNDMQILPNVRGLFQIISILGITDMDEAEPITVTIGLNEIMSLLKASFISPTPLSDLILNKTRKTNSVIVKSEPKALHQIENEAENPNSKKMTLKVMVQKSSGKLLYAQAEEDFVEFLFSFFHIPLGGAEHLLAGKTSVKAIDNLYRSITDLIDNEYFKTTFTKNRLMKPNLAHGCISKDHILPLTEECLPAHYTDNLSYFSSVKFPKGQGRYLDGPRTYLVTDDLTVTPFCIHWILSDLNKLKILISDVEEVQLQISLKEALSVLKASLTSTSALTDALLNHKSNKHGCLKRERQV